MDEPRSDRHDHAGVVHAFAAHPGRLDGVAGDAEHAGRRRGCRFHGRAGMLWQRASRRARTVVDIIEERAGDRSAVEAIARLSLGDRLTDSPAARMRQGTEPVPDLCLVALDGGRPVATIRYWPVLIGAGTRALQLGPVAVHPDHRGRGISRALIRASLARAAAMGHRIVVLIGDGALYRRYGFEPALARHVTLAETRDRDRLHILGLVPDALSGLEGAVRPDTIPALR